MGLSEEGRFDYSGGLVYNVTQGFSKVSGSVSDVRIVEL